MSGFRFSAILMLILNFVLWMEASAGGIAEVDSSAAGATGSGAAAGATGGEIANSIGGAFQAITCTKNMVPSTQSSNIPQIYDMIVNPAAHGVTCPSPELVKLTQQATALKKDSEACPSRFDRANTWCLEGCSPDVKNIVSAANGIIAGFKQTSLADACNKTSKIMDLVQMGLTAFTGNCGAQKMMCDTSCGGAVKTLGVIETQIQSIVISCPNPVETGPQQAAWATYKTKLSALIKKEINPEDKQTVGGMARTCTGYSLNIASALAGAASSLMSAKQAANCNKQTNNVAAQDTTCNNPALANTQKCICEKAPRTPGCTLANGTTSTNSNFGSPSSSTTTSGTGGAGLVGGAGLGGDIAGLRKGEAGSVDGGGAGAPSGGGGGGLDGGGGGGSGGGNGQQQIVRKFGTNIYGGEGGGGGGAFGRMGGGSGGSQGAADTRSPAAVKAYEAQILRQQISSDGGRSNWEKIKVQYGQQKPSLLGI